MFVLFTVAFFISLLAIVKASETVVFDSVAEVNSNKAEKRNLRSLDNPNLRSHDHSLSGPQLFHSIAKKQVKYTDKIEEHKYSEMYGTFLFPYIRRTHQMGKQIKFFEIGLGCDAVMTTSDVRGVKVWKGVLAEQDELWVAEYDQECVAKAVKQNMLKGVHVLEGDQSDGQVLQSWIKASGGKWDVIVDDGGHYQHHIYNSFKALWPEVKPGGLYFIEDLHVAREFIDKNSNFQESMMDYLYNWQEYLVTNRVLGEQTAANLAKYRPPPGIRWIACQAEACVIAKCEDMSNEVTRCT